MTAERFNENWIHETSTNCWLWIGKRDRHGYGKIGGRLAHRIAWELFNGSIPAGLCVCHKCDTRHCVYPGHLFLGTVADNNADMMRKGRFRFTRMQGEKHGRSKLTKDDVLSIRASESPIRELKKQFKISRAQIHKIRKGTTWTHLTAQ